MHDFFMEVSGIFLTLFFLEEIRFILYSLLIGYIIYDVSILHNINYRKILRVFDFSNFTRNMRYLHISQGKLFIQFSANKNTSDNYSCSFSVNLLEKL